MKDDIYSQMNINDYEVWVSLGCTAAEQSLKQPVVFDLKIKFSSAIGGEKTDQLNDSIDYVKLTDILKHSAESKSYNLIENMCFEATNRIADFLISNKIQGQLEVSLLKLRPPVPNLKSGVSWVCQRQLS